MICIWRFGLRFIGESLNTRVEPDNVHDKYARYQGFEKLICCWSSA